MTDVNHAFEYRVRKQRDDQSREIIREIEGDDQRIAKALGPRQRETILSLSADWGPASSHTVAKALWYRDEDRCGRRLVDHRHRTDNVWCLTSTGQRVRAILQETAR